MLTGCGLRTRDFIETEKWSGKCSYSKRNDISTEHLLSISLKTTEKRKEKNNNKINFHLVSFEVLHMFATNCYAR